MGWKGSRESEMETDEGVKVLRLLLLLLPGPPAVEAGVEVKVEAAALRLTACRADLSIRLPWGAGHRRDRDRSEGQAISGRRG